MKKLLENQTRFHGYKTQYDYYRTSGVMFKYFSGEPLDINDKINYRSMYIVSQVKI